MSIETGSGGGAVSGQTSDSAAGTHAAPPKGVPTGEQTPTGEDAPVHEEAPTGQNAPAPETEPMLKAVLAAETSRGRAERPGLKMTERAQSTAHPFPSAHQDRLHARLDVETPQTESPSYRLSYEDPDFLMRDELRGARLQLEFLKPDLLMRDRGIAATVVVFGSARIPDPEQAAARLEETERWAAEDPRDPERARRLRATRNLVEKTRYYEEARRLAQMICVALGKTAPEKACIVEHEAGNVVVVTGGGPGIMEAANRGAYDIGAESIGLNIVLPFEQAPNRYITPHLSFNFHYFAIRKMHFLLRAVALVVFPGGYGTLDELFEVLTLIQTRKILPIPVLLFSREYWEKIIDFEAMVEEGVISPDDVKIFQYVESADQAWEILRPVIESAGGTRG